MEEQLNEFVGRLKAAAGENLESVILYGSAASGEFHREFSDVNLLCVLRDLSAPALQAFFPAVSWWIGKNHPAPLIFTQEELKRSADVFAIEFLDIQHHHRVLHGEDVFAGLQVPLGLHRVQLEHELRTKLLLLRQHYLVAAGDRKRVLALMLDSVSSFITLFKHALIALGEKPARSRREIVARLAQRTGLNAGIFSELLDIREGKQKQDALDVQSAFPPYLLALEQVVRVVDEI